MRTTRTEQPSVFQAPQIDPADSTRCLPMLRRHVEAFGEPPQRAAFDGGYASKQNLSDAKELGVEHVVFHKKSGLEPADMTPSSWIYGQLTCPASPLQALPAGSLSQTGGYRTGTSLIRFSMRSRGLEAPCS